MWPTSMPLPTTGFIICFNGRRWTYDDDTTTMTIGNGA
jgi:hypothetical protein